MKRIECIGAVAVLLISSGCHDTILPALEVARVQIQGVPSATVAAGDTLRPAVLVTGADGSELSGMNVSWTSSDSSVLRILDAGAVLAAGEGEAALIAEVGGMTGSAVVRVGPAPSLLITEDSVVLRAMAGSSASTLDSVEVLNPAAGVVRDLTATVLYPAESPAGWLEATLDGSVTPTRLRLSGIGGSLSPGRYSATVTVHSLRGDSTRALPVVLLVQTGISNWAVQLEGRGNTDFNGVWLASENDGYAVGGGSVFHFDGTTWTPVWTLGPLYYPTVFRDVWGSSPTDVWAVGDRVIAHFDGDRWAHYAVPTNASYLLAVWGASPTDVFAVGQSGAIVHFDGGTWRIAREPDTGVTWADVSGTSQGNVFVVGNSRQILHFDGSAWSVQESGATRPLHAVWAAGPAGAFAVGDSGTVVHYDGTGWSTMESGTTHALGAVWGRSPTDVYAAGEAGVLIHFDGSAWSPVASRTKVVLTGIAGRAAGPIVAVGQRGTVVRGDGADWNVLRSAPTLEGVWFAGREGGFAVGEFGTILRYDGSRWIPVESGSAVALRAVWGSSPSDAFAVGDGGTILHFNGAHWQAMESGTKVNLRSVTGHSSTDVYAGGDTGTLLHFDGTAWQTISQRDRNSSYSDLDFAPGGDLLGASSVYSSIFRDIFSYTNRLSSFDGTQWTDVDLPQGFAILGPGIPPAGVWASPQGTIFATAFPSTILRGSGSSWVPSAINGRVHRLWGSSDSDVYAVGDAIYHFEGSGWSAVSAQRQALLNDIAGPSPDEVFAVGENLTILRGTR